MEQAELDMSNSQACECGVQEVPELALDIIFGALDAHALASVSLACVAWRQRVSSSPDLFLSAFWQRFGTRVSSGWWPFFEKNEQLFGYRDFRHLYQATLLAEGDCEARVLKEALKRQLYHRGQYQKALEANQQVAAVCERSLAKSKAALGRHLSPRALLPFGRRAGVTQASLQREVEHWQRELQAEQATIHGLEPMLAQALAKVARIQGRLGRLARRRGALLDARPDLSVCPLLASMLDKFALPKLRARISAAYMFYDKTAHAIKV